MRRTRLISAIALALLTIGAGLTRFAHAADIRPVIDGGYRGIVIEGPIEAGDFDTFIKIVRENQGLASTVYLFTPGGDFDEAMRIGRAMRALELASQVPMRSAAGTPICSGSFLNLKPADPKNCTAASAGFFIHIGGVHRGGTYLAVHRPYIDPARFSQMPPAIAEKRFDELQANARRYMKEMGVPESIQDQVLNTPSDGILVLDEQTVHTHFWGEASAFRHESLRSKCNLLSPTDRSRLNSYGERILRARGGHTDLSDTEYKDLGELQTETQKELDCSVALERQARNDAYEKYFGTAPTDYGNEDFEKWATAHRYLGRAFYEITAEEKFSSVDTSKPAMLEKKRTASSPGFLITEDYVKPKVAGEVAVFSAGHPSAEYTRRLVSALEKAWGPRTGGNGTAEWSWKPAGYTAVLTMYPQSADGPYLVLRMRASNNPDGPALRQY